MRFTLFLVILCALIFISEEKAMGEDIKSVLPESIDGWISHEKIRTYNRQNIFDYLDGGAELYLAYNMELLISRRYSKNNEADMVIDIFQMKNGADAFGLFSHDYSGNETNIGRGSEYESGLLVFWKGNYYVSILSEKETDASKKAVMKIGALISDYIKYDVPPPPIINYFKHQSLKKIYYFNTYQCMNFYHFLSDKNILGLNDTTDAGIGEYTVNGNAVHLLVIMYPELQDASTAYENYFASYMGTKSTAEPLKTKDGKWTGAYLGKRLLALVLDGKNKNDVNVLFLIIKSTMKSD